MGSRESTIANTSDAYYRPMSLFKGPEGSLYISDSEKGKIWHIMYQGNRDKFGGAQLSDMEKRKTHAPNLKTPDEVKDILIPKDGVMLRGRNPLENAKLFDTYYEGTDRGTIVFHP